MDARVEYIVDCLLKKLRPISFLIWGELLLALALVFWIQYSSGETTVGAGCCTPSPSHSGNPKHSSG